MPKWKRASKKRPNRVPPTRVEVRPTPPRLDASAVHHAGDGRVHLNLLPTDAHRRIATGLSRPLFDEEWQDTLTLSAANAVFRHLENDGSPGAVSNLTKEAEEALSKLSAGLIRQSLPATVACRVGCDHCCHQSVGVTPFEAIAITEHLQASSNAAEMERWKRRVRENRERARGLSRQERYSPDHPCVFLGSGGACAIYPVRPLVCRAMNSLDEAACRSNLRDPERRAAFLEEGRGAPSLLGPFRASHAMSAGLQLAGSDGYGYDMRPLDLVAAVDELLENRDAPRRWLSGEPLLRSAVGSDATDDPSLRSVAGLPYE